MLGANIRESVPSESPFLHRVLNGQTTSAYLITRKFAPTLLGTFRESMRQLESIFLETKKISEEYVLDTYWKRIQPSSMWFVLNPKLGIQRKSFSDIENKITNYMV
jgi:hypothetical protein